MASTTQSEKPINEGIKNLKIDPSKLGDTNLAPSKDRSLSDTTSCISSTGDASSSVRDIDLESLMADQGMYYPANNYYSYYYPGYDSPVGKLNDQGYFLNNDGLEIQYPVIQGNNGSLAYYVPSFQPDYGPYSPYFPGATIGIDGQYLGQQPYVLSPMSPQPIATSGYFPTLLPYGSELMPSYLWDPSLLVGDGPHGNGYGAIPTVPVSKPSFSAPSRTFSPSKSIPSKFNNPEMKGSLPALVIPSGPGILNELKPMNKAAGILSKGFLYPNSPVNFRANGRAWGGTEKFKSRGRTSGTNIIDTLNEQNRGPRTNSAKGAFALGLDPVDSPASEFNGNNDSSTTVTKRDQYNVPDFPTKYDDALFFVIKSYSEDDIHKSIKYNVWSSTPNGNKRLDNAYQDSHEKMGQKGSKCPVFLFFSVNASGQFCGVAEMIGRVDFNKNMDFWQQDKWNGFFPVKWHIIKDVPNPHFRHIILENNDNKPVTNSRDTQEIKFPQGIEMLNIFKDYLSKMSILDDFSFYESRQKIMQDKRIRPSTRYLGHLQKPDEVMQVAPTGLQSIDLVAAKKKNELMIGDEATDE